MERPTKPGAHLRQDRVSAPTWRLELHSSGGILSNGGQLELGPGDGVGIELRLTTGNVMQFAAQVRWIRSYDQDSGTAQGAWVDFIDLHPAERREFQSWLRRYRAEHDSVSVSVAVRHKFRVRRQGSRVTVWLGGRLEAADSEALANEVIAATPANRSGALALYIHADAFAPSPEDSLARIRRWLDHCARKPTTLGVLIGRPSVGIMQFGRLVREAGLADSLVSFDSPEAAQAAWTMVVEQIALLDQAAGQSGTFARLQ